MRSQIANNDAHYTFLVIIVVYMSLFIADTLGITYIFQLTCCLKGIPHKANNTEAVFTV